MDDAAYFKGGGRSGQAATGGQLVEGAGIVLDGEGCRQEADGDGSGCLAGSRARLALHQEMEIKIKPCTFSWEAVMLSGKSVG